MSYSAPNDRFMENSLHRSQYLSFPSVTLFILPFLTMIQINVVGTLLGTDLFCLLLLPVLLFNGRFYVRQPVLPVILAFMAGWFLSALLTDFVAESPIRNALRGWASIIFFALSLCTIFILVDQRKERLFMLLLGYGAMLPIRWILGADLYQSSGSFFSSFSWKFGSGFGLTLLTGLLLSRLLPNAKGLVLTIMSPIHLFLNARSMFLTTFLAALMTTVSVQVSNRKSRLSLGLFLVLIAATGLPAAEFIYGKITLSGFFGQEAMDKYMEQTQGGLGILLGGRSESLISFQAISESPLLGHGSWAESLDYRTRYYEALEAAGKTVHWSELHKNLLIPGHSHILGAWIQHGVLGALFWFFILGLIIRAVYSSVLGLHRAAFPEMLVLTTALWDLPFSPFGQQGRVTMSIAIVIAIYVIEKAKAADSSKGQDT